MMICSDLSLHSAYPLEERVKAILDTGASLALRRLVDVERSPFMLQTIVSFVAEHEGKPYDSSFGTLARSALKRNNTEDLSKFFCSGERAPSDTHGGVVSRVYVSELVAALYRKLGVLHDGSLANNYTPKDFTAPVVPGVVRGRFERRKKYGKRDYLVDRGPPPTLASSRASGAAPQQVSSSELEMLFGASTEADSVPTITVGADVGPHNTSTVPHAERVAGSGGEGGANANQ